MSENETMRPRNNNQRGFGNQNNPSVNKLKLEAGLLNSNEFLSTGHQQLVSSSNKLSTHNFNGDK
jgi:hypothetical protein